MNKYQAIRAIYSSVITLCGDDAFDANGNPVTYDETAVQNYMNANAYKDQRAQAYPSIADQLDILYHGGLDAWKTAIQEVKDRYPK